MSHRSSYLSALNSVFTDKVAESSRNLGGAINIGNDLGGAAEDALFAINEDEEEEEEEEEEEGNRKAAIATSAASTRRIKVFDTKYQQSWFVDAKTFALFSKRNIQREDSAGGLVALENKLIDDKTFNEKYEVDLEELFEDDDNATTFVVSNDEIKNTGGMIGKCWRATYRKLIVTVIDAKNALRFSRQLQIQIDYLMPHEALLLSDVVEALDAISRDSSDDVRTHGKKKMSPKAVLNMALLEALKNRNVGRVLVQSSGSVNYFFHADSQLSNLRKFDFFGSVFVIGRFVQFPPASENFLNTRAFAINSILRELLGPGRWITRVITGGREEFVVDDKGATAQNLAAETTGFEAAMRNQYGNYAGRHRVNDFRHDNRLPTDESAVRTFNSQPAATMINNGSVHLLRALANHWEALNSIPFGNFAHQRMEQLNVCQMLRFQMPSVLTTLANLRGLNSWDTTTLGPFVKELMNLRPGVDMTEANNFLTRLKEDIVYGVCGGVSSRIEPFQKWLTQMRVSSELIMVEKESVKSVLATITAGIDAGHKLAKTTNWEVPEDQDMIKSLLLHIKLDVVKKRIRDGSGGTLINEQTGVLRMKPDGLLGDVEGQDGNQAISILRELSYVELESTLELMVAEKALKLGLVNQIKKEVLFANGDRGLTLPISHVINIIAGADPSRADAPMMNIESTAARKLMATHEKVLNIVLQFVKDDLAMRQKNGMNDHLCKRALSSMRPRDKRTVIELVLKGFEATKPSKLLLNRIKTLLQRELRRATIDRRIEELSRGEITSQLVTDNWYIVERVGGSENVNLGVFQYRQELSAGDLLFVNRAGKDNHFDMNNYQFRMFIPIAQAIVRAQKGFMTIELDYLKRFSYDAFMEFDDMRGDLQKLLVISQIQSYKLDEARINMLVNVRENSSTQINWTDLKVGVEYFIEVKPYKYELFEFTDGMELDKRKRYFKIPPQNLIVVGGGPTGLLTTLHCLENCLKTGGTMKLYEARDAFEKAGGTYERAQVVRLDSRWVRMLRYHLGTSYEDVWIPASGETDAHLGNTLPTQGFIEITIKDMEAVLHLEISKLWSRNLLEIHSKSSAEFDHKKNVMTKRGNALKVNDIVLRNKDQNGKPSEELHTWEVIELVEHPTLGPQDMTLGHTYDIYARQHGGLVTMQLKGIDLQANVYTFENSEQDINITAPAANFPAVYKYDSKTKAHSTFKSIVFASVEISKRGNILRDEIPFSEVMNESHIMDVGQTNIAFAVGKPLASKEHLKICPEEPYGVACIQGLKISMNMHNFGEKRFGDGLANDIRSQTEQNTRVVGDFTKSVITEPIVQEMWHIMTKSSRAYDWMTHYNNILKRFPEQKEFIRGNIGEEIQKSLVTLKADAKNWGRKRLQTRFFETGDNFYLGMEFNREYDLWKQTITDDIVGNAPNAGRLKGTLKSQIDRLWYEAVCEVISKGDVYNPSGRNFIPKVYFINSSTDVQLRTFKDGDGFRLTGDKAEKYEVLVAGSLKVLVRTVEGIVLNMDGDTIVHRESDLTRGPDGNAESRVSIATFPVSHYVNYRSINVQKSPYWCTFALGDGQSSPHFMRYSGLTGAALNSMLVNNYLGSSLSRESIFSRRRVQELSHETNWSNDEVVKRGTGANYGRDGFLRPGAKYDNLMEHLYYKALEMEIARYRELLDEDPIDAMFMLSWMKTFGAALIPRGMELNDSHTNALTQKLGKMVLQRLFTEMKGREELNADESDESFLKLFQKYADDGMGMTSSTDGTLMGGCKDMWARDVTNMLEKSGSDMTVKDIVMEYMNRGDVMAEVLHRAHLLARDEHIDGKRISSESENEPNSTDSLIADFAVEAQAFASGLELSSLLATLSLATSNSGNRIVGIVFSILIALFNIPTAFGTITNVSRYANRNEEFRKDYYNSKLFNLEKTLYKALSSSKRKMVADDVNPLMKQVRNTFMDFCASAKYYDTDCEVVKDSFAQTDLRSLKSVEGFISEVTSVFIPTKYQKEVYVKDKLIVVYAACVELLTSLQEDKYAGTEGYIEDEATFNALLSIPTFSKNLKGSLQEGSIKWGFIRKRKSFTQFVLFAPIRYTYFRCSNVFHKAAHGCLGPCYNMGGIFQDPISTQIKIMFGLIRSLNTSLGNSLKREARDLKELFHATMESALATCLCLVGIGSFTFAFFLVANGIGSAVRNTGTTVNGSPMNAWEWFQVIITEGAALVSACAAILALVFFLRLVRHQRSVVKSIGNLPSPPKSVVKINTIANVNTFIVILQILASAGSVSSLVLGCWNRWSSVGEDRDIVLYVALASLGAWALGIVFSRFVDLFLLFNLEASVGKDICRSYWGALTLTHDQYNVGRDSKSIVSPALLERNSWEYTAREFLTEIRFDTVLGADRFNAIMQCIQSGDTSSWRSKALFQR